MKVRNSEDSKLVRTIDRKTEKIGFNYVERFKYRLLQIHYKILCFKIGLLSF